MTTLTINIEEGHEEDVKTFLRNADFKAEIVRESKLDLVAEPESAYERLIKLQEEIGDQALLKEIKDPSEWQREIRKEWDRDF